MIKRTENEYLKRAESIKNHFEKETGLELFENLNEFFYWIEERVSDWSPATRRQYKAAIKFLFKQKNIEFNNKKLSEVFQSSISKKEVRKKHGKRTSAQKAKNMKRKVWRHIKFALENSSSRVAMLTLNILQASAYFGLRPIEWAYSEFLLKGVSIRGIKVKNAKATEGRSFGEYRTIYINEEVADDYFKDSFHQAFISADQIIMYFENMKKNILRYENDQEQIEIEYRRQAELELRACRILLGQINTRLEKKGVIKKDQRITLYSGRHQFAANAKSFGLSSIEIAALMGHGAIDTNEKFYGRKINGRGGFGVNASNADIEKINFLKNNQKNLSR